MTWGLMPAERDLVTWHRGSAGIQAREDLRVSFPLRSVGRGQSAQGEGGYRPRSKAREETGWVGA